jgi:hypothetical protein
VIQNQTNETKNKVDKSHGAKKCYLIQIIIIIIFAHTFISTLKSFPSYHYSYSNNTFISISSRTSLQLLPTNTNTKQVECWIKIKSNLVTVKVFIFNVFKGPRKHDIKENTTILKNCCSLCVGTLLLHHYFHSSNIFPTIFLLLICIICSEMSQYQRREE